MDIRDHVIDLSMRIFQAATAGGRNKIVSPLGAVAALSAMLRGASGNTRAQLEEKLGIEPEALQQLLLQILRKNKPAETELRSFFDRDPGEESRVHMGTAIWLNDRPDLHFQEKGLNRIRETVNCEIFQTSDTRQARQRINRWCEEKTDGMVREFVDSISPRDVALLVNALVFDGKWSDAYKPADVYDRTFTDAAGQERQVPFLHGKEKGYLEDGDAVGFVKPYTGGYSFVALLPAKGVSLQEYAKSLTGQRLKNILENRICHEVLTATPKFECKSEHDMQKIFRALGVTEAFDGNGNFSELYQSDDPALQLRLDRFCQQAYVTVDEKGTRAFALTGFATLSMVRNKPKPYQVYLDRPFLYMIIDNKTNIPLFMGTVNKV